MKKNLIIFTSLLMLVPAAYLFIDWKNIPDIVPMHYNLKGEVDRYGKKSEMIVAVGILSVVNMLTFLLLLNAHRIDPKKHASENKERLARMAVTVSIFITAITTFLVYSSSNNIGKMAPKMIFAGVGLLFSFLGNYMHTIKPNYFAGFRMPWTLENEDNWKKTHLLAGKLWFAGGLIISVISLILPMTWLMILFFIIIAVLVIIPAVYSYRLYRKNKEQTI